jgi:hypothetical protein
VLIHEDKPWSDAAVIWCRTEGCEAIHLTDEQLELAIEMMQQGHDQVHDLVAMYVQQHLQALQQQHQQQ